MVGFMCLCVCAVVGGSGNCVPNIVYELTSKDVTGIVIADQ